MAGRRLSLPSSAGTPPPRACCCSWKSGDRDLDPSSGPVVAEFLKAQPDVNAPDHEGDTPLHLAVRAGRKELASLLNQHGAHPLLKNKAGETPMAMVDKASPNMQWQRPNLLPPGAKADPAAAAAGGDLDSLKVWLALDPVRVISTNGVLLNAAASRCRTNVVEFLVSNGVPLNAFAALMTGQTNEFAALLSGQPEAARSRWPHAPRTDRFVTVHGSGSRTVTVQAPLLHHAVALGNGGAVGMLLEAGADVDAADSEGHTALYRSLTNETTQLAARLRAAGAAENAIDLIAQNHIEQLQGRAAKALAMAPTNRAEGPHPLVFALQRTNVAAVKLLLDAGADPDTPAPEAYGFPIPFYPKNGSSRHAPPTVWQLVTPEA
ncbi:MAG: hypothetical protein EBS05_25110 [Proteobacteria bacterium]|nr:hypothetical protein [Pseudomonadota bacterium]